MSATGLRDCSGEMVFCDAARCDMPATVRDRFDDGRVRCLCDKRLDDLCRTESLHAYFDKHSNVARDGARKGKT